METRQHWEGIIVVHLHGSTHHLFSFRYRRNLLTFRQNSALFDCWAIFTMLVTCLKTMATLGLQPIWFTPFHLFLTEKLLYYVFVDIFHSLLIPLIMARTIPWEPPKGEGRDNEFYVRQPDVLEPRRLISIQSEQRRVEQEGIQTLSLMKRNFKKTQNIDNGAVFPKQAFRSTPLRMKGEMKIWRGANEFGHPVLFYSRHHGWGTLLTEFDSILPPLT